MSFTQTNYIPGMDGLRAVAALSVFAVHFNQMAGLEFTAGPFDLARMMANGNHGVSLFFSLSGFLLSLPFWHCFLEGRSLPAFRTYYTRRFARILPAYYLLLTLLVLFGGYWKIPGAWVDILSHYLMIFNFTEFTIFSISPPFWTLAVELQFYLLLPAVFLSMAIFRNKKYGLYVLCFFIIVACGMQYILVQKADRVISWPLNPWLTWIQPHGAVVRHSLIATLPHFLMGAAAGYFHQIWTRRSRPLERVRTHGETIFWSSLATAVVLLSTGWINKVSLSFIPYGFPVIPFVLVCLIITAPFTRTAVKILESPVLKPLGTISYGLYLYHFPCLIFLEWQMRLKGMDVGTHWILFGGSGLFITIILAGMSYFLIERPFLRLVRRK